MRRRTFMGTGGLLVGVMAGCLGSGVGENGLGSDPRETPALDTAFDVTARNCGQGEDRTTVSYGDGTITVDGTIGGSNTCQTAALRSVRMEDGSLRAEVVTTRAETGTPACGQCLTDIEYVLRISYDGSPPDEVVVVHDGAVVRRVGRPSGG